MFWVVAVFKLSQVALLVFPRPFPVIYRSAFLRLTSGENLRKRKELWDRKMMSLDWMEINGLILT